MANNYKKFASLGFNIITEGTHFITFSRVKDEELTLIDFDTRDGSFNVVSKYENETIATDLSIDVAVALVELAKALGI